MASVNDQDSSNMYNMVQMIDNIQNSITKLQDDMSDVRSFMMSPLPVYVNDINISDQSASNLNQVLSVNQSPLSRSDDILSNSDRAFFSKAFDVQGEQVKILIDISSKLSSTTESIEDYSRDTADNTSEMKRNTNSESMSRVLSSILTSASGLLLKSTNKLSSFAFDNIEKMINARNDIMYEYGLTNPKEADELYKLQFEHKAMPFQHRSAPEWRDYRRTQQSTAIDLGYNTEQSVEAVTEQLYKWQDIFEDINFSSSDLFKNTMRFVDKSGETFNEIMTTVQEASTNYIVTPTLLEEVASSYSKYLRIVTKSNTAFSKSMNNLVTTVAKLEDAGVSSQGFYEEIQNFQYSSLSNAANSDMWTRLAIMGIDPNSALRMDQADLMNAYTEGLKNYFSEFDVRNANDRQMINIIAQDQLGYSASQMQDLYDLLLSEESASGGASESTETDYQKQLAIDAEEYYDHATAGWTYLTESQKFQDAITSKILNNDGLVNVYEKWEETTKGLVDINETVDTISSFLVGGGLLKLLEDIIPGGSHGGGLLGGLLGGAGAKASPGVLTGLGNSLFAVGGNLVELGGAELGTGASATVAGTTALGAGAILGGVLGAAGIGKGAYDIYKGYKGVNADGTLMTEDQKKDKYWSGGTALGMVGSGAATGALIGSVVPGLGTAVGGLIGAGVGGAGALLGSTKAGEFLHDKWDEFTADGGLWDQIKSGSIWDDVKDKGTDAFNTVIGLADMTMEGTFGTERWNKIKGLVSDAFSGVKEFFTETLPNTWDKFTENLSNLKKKLSDWYEGSWLKKVIDFLGDKIGEGFDTVKTYAETKIENTKEGIGNAWNTFKSVLSLAKDRGEDITNKSSSHSHANGLNYVPYDGYQATLHEGERVLTSAENAQYRYQIQSSNNFNKDLLESDKDMIDNQDELNYSLSRNNQNGILNSILGLKSKTSDNTDTIKSNNTNLKSNTSIIKNMYELLKDHISNGLTSLSGLGSSGSANSLTSAASNLISSFEGSATSINGNDNGALSIGKMQWHGDNAKSLLQGIYNADPTAFTNLANQYGVSSLVSSVTGSGSWSHKAISSNSPEYQAIQAILGSSAGQSVQNQMQSSYVQSYLDKGKSLGLTDPSALIYFADFANQYGSNSPKLKQITSLALQNGGTLDAMYRATQSVVGNAYSNRRSTAYNQIKGMDLSVVEGNQSVAGTEARRSIISFVKSKLGSPYVWGSSGPNSFDCSGLVSAAGNAAGILKGRLTTEAMKNNVQKINSVDELIPGDIVMGNWSSSKGRFQHTGVYVGNNTIIHASGSQSKPDKVKESSFSSFWGGKYVGLGAYARGGVIESPTFSLLGEGGYSEYVIPTDPKYKDQSTALLSKAASDVGVATLSTSADTGTNKITEVYVDTDGIIDAVEELSKIVEKGFRMFERANTPQQESQSTSNSILSYT